MELETFKGINRSELSLIEVAHAILSERGEIFEFETLLLDVQTYLGFDDEYLENIMVRFYTDLNTDGRFISLGDNRWALRSWYAVDEIDEEIINSLEDEDLPRLRRLAKRKTISAFADEDEDIIDYNEDDPEDVDGIYDDDYEKDDLDDDEDDDDHSLDHNPDDDDEDDSELDDYERDLDELGEDELDDEDFDEDIDEDDDDFDEDDLDD